MAQKWQGHTDGNRWMQQQLINCFRFLNLRIYYAGVACVVPFYMLFGAGFKSSYHYFRRRQHFGKLKSLVYIYRQYFRFGQVMIDRFACYAGKTFHVEIEHYERFTDAALRKEAFVMLSGHVGNYEIGGYHLVAENKPINALVYAGETEVVRENREILFGKNNIRLIPMQSDMSHVFAMNNAFHNGEIVSIPADRCIGSEKTVECCFMGAKARFPKGAFSTIVLEGIKALPIFVMKEGVNRYRIFVEELEMPPAELKREEKIKHLAQQYAAQLERIVRKYPEQWFNFFEFWDDSQGV